MASTNFPTPQEILEGLGKDPLFAKGSALYEAFKDHIVHLPEVIDKQLLGQPLDLTTLMRLRLDFMRDTLRRGMELAESDRRYLEGILDELEDELTYGLERTAADYDVSVEDIMVSTRTGMTEATRQAYLAGGMTVRDALAQPSLFIQVQRS